MARISKEELDWIKQNVPMAGICQRYGIELKPQGKDLICCCPFHEETDASFRVTPANNLWNCFGCNQGGDNIKFVEKKEGISFRHAVEKLQQMVGKVPETPAIKTRQGKEHPALVDPAEALDDALTLVKVMDFYHQTFLNQSAAMKYLEKRKCFHPEAVKLFKIGYANRTLGYRVPPQGTEAGKAMKQQLQRIGIYRETGHEHLSGSVVFPIISPTTGEVTEMYGRKINDNLREGTAYHLYLTGPHRGVWNQAGVQGKSEWILCESIIDALSFWCQGYRNVTASYGAGGFTPDHWTLLRASGVKQVIICYDNDEAGNKAANELAQQLEPEGIAAWRAELAPRSDVNDLVRNSDDPRNALALLLAAVSRMLPDSTLINAAPGCPTTTPEPVLLSEPSSTELVPEPVLEILPEPPPPKEKPQDQPQLPPPARPEPPPLLTPPIAEPQEIKETKAQIEAHIEGAQADFCFAGCRSYRVRGLDKNNSFDQLKVTVRLQVGETAHFDTFDLYQARSRAGFIAAAASAAKIEGATVERDLSHIIRCLEEHQDGKLIKKMAVIESLDLTAEEEREAMDTLKSPKLLERVLADAHKIGLVGEESNILIAWLVTLSRKLDRPLGICVMSRSAAGKSSLLETVARFVPETDKHQYTAITPQALFHMPENELRHKALFIAEDVGAEGAAYSLKTIQSDGQLVIACTVKDEETGQMVTRTKIVKGPVALFLTSTSRSVDDELLNRLLILAIDESAEQTRRIHEMQRHAHSLEGIIERRARPKIIKRQQNIQRLIRPLLVRNPFQSELSFNSTRLRSRRDNDKYLALINVMALVHQYQRPIHSAVDADGQTFQYIEATREDVERVESLLRDILPQTTDELTPQSRRMLAALEELARRQPVVQGQLPRFTRRQIREATGWSDTQVRLVIEQLVTLEYVWVYGGGQGRRTHYQLAEQVSLDNKNGCNVTLPSHHFAETSQSPNCEVILHPPAPLSSSILAASLAAEVRKNGSSHTSSEAMRSRKNNA